MKTAIILVILGLLTGVGSIKTVDTMINQHITATNHANGRMQDVQALQGGEDNTIYVLQPADYRQEARIRLQADYDEPELQPAAGYEALNWQLR